MAARDYDWIDDAFDDKKTAEEMEQARGPRMAGVLLVVVLIASLLLVMFGVVGIVGALGSL